jgi:hypothetical protein
MVEFAIAHDLGSPEINVRARPSEEGTVMSVPEAAINKHDNMMLRQHDIRFAREILSVNTIAEAAREQT